MECRLSAFAKKKPETVPRLGIFRRDAQESTTKASPSFFQKRYSGCESTITAATSRSWRCASGT